MSINVRNGGLWKPSTPNVRSGGLWKPVKEGYVRSGGVWRKFYPDSLVWNVSGAVRPPDIYYGELVGYVAANPALGSINPTTIEGITLTHIYIILSDVGTPSVSIQAALIFNVNTLLGRQVRINGELVTCNQNTGVYYSATVEGSMGLNPASWQNLPFIFCGWNRTQDPRTYSKFAQNFTVELLL